jgi:diguanylate cyclase (GGDEF)-like protein
MTVAMQILKRRLLRAEERQRDMAERDPLTGLHNRRAFDAALADQLTRGPAALVLFDFDGFKQVNDRHGHPTGDAVLCTVATVCRGAIREVDHLARLGGDEFALIAPAAGEAGIERIVGALEEAIAGADMPLGLTITATFAWARAPEDAGDTDGLLRCADQRLLARKRERHSPVAA